jgi:hypothetical protein
MPSRKAAGAVAAVLVALVAVADAAPAQQRWQPPPRAAWQWQLTTPVDLSVRAYVYDIDGFENGAAVVRKLHAGGHKVICYIDAGAWESYRPDADLFPADVLGKPDRPWPGERWLDIRRLDVLAPIMRARLDMCAAKGFDAVEPDEVDGYANDTGFPLAPADQLRYNRFLAREAHVRGLAVALKNDVDQVSQLVRDFDFAINEQCFQYRECGKLSPFVRRGKAVFHVEYSIPASRFCPVTTRLGFSSMRKHLDLGAWREPCPADHVRRAHRGSRAPAGPSRLRGDAARKDRGSASGAARAARAARRAPT